MENEPANREFDFKTCPWCGYAYKDSEIGHVYSDRGDIHRLVIRCDGCGMIYSAERKTTWLAKGIRVAGSPQEELSESRAEEGIINK
jgi:rubredoxin